jgi:hypothetical protein
MAIFSLSSRSDSSGLGNSKFGRSKGQPPMPDEALRNYIAKFALVLDVDEYKTSQAVYVEDKFFPMRYYNFQPMKHK